MANGGERKMRKIITSMVLAGLVAVTPLQAVPNDSPFFNETGSARSGTGVGASVGIRINLGSDRVVKKKDRIKLGLSAGPVFVRQNSSNVDRVGLSLIEVEMKPGYETSFQLAGNPVAVDYTQLGAAENGKEDKGDKDDDKRGTAETVLIVAGGILVAGLVVGAATLGIACRDGRCSE
jgi:hypothetical protein